MKNLAKNKVKYILLRYQVESKELSAALRLELLKKWISSCVEFEEYEMALALKGKRNELIKDLRHARVGYRHFLDAVVLRLKWKIRKWKRKFL